MEDLKAIFVDNGLVYIIVPILSQALKVRYKTSPNQTRLLFIIMSLFFAILYYFISQNATLWESVKKILGITCGVYYIFNSAYKFNEEPKNKTL